MKRTNTAKWIEREKRWKLQVQHNGRRRSFYSSTPGRAGQREANAKADAWLEDGITDQRQRVAQVYPLFLESKQDTTSYSNYRPMESRWRAHIVPILGAKAVATLTEQDLQEVLDKAFRRGKLSTKTLENLRSDLTAFCRWCRKSKRCTLIPEELTIPAAAVSGEKTILQPRDFVVLFNSDETTFRGRVVHDDLIHAYRLAALTGLRPGELRGLRWGDLKRDRLELHRSINQYQQETRGKNENARRAVELSKLAIAELAAQRSESSDTRINAPIFYIPTNNYFEAHLRRYCEHNEIPVVTPYELRHTFVSIAKTLPAGLVKSLVGHSKNMDTFGTYGHALDTDAADRAAALDDRFTALLLHSG